MLAQGREGLPPVHGHGLGKTAYERHQPEQTLLYQLVEAHYPALVDQLAQQGKSLPDHVHRDFEAYLKCGRLEYGFLRVRCDKCHFERLVAFSCKRRGFCPSCGARRMAETAALLAEEVFPDVPLRQWVISFPFPLRYLFAAHPQAMGKAPDRGELEELIQLISLRVGRCLERLGLLEQDTESAWLDLDPAEVTDAMPQILGSSISYRIAVGPQQGHKAFMIRTIRPLDRPDPGLERVARANGFSLHAGVSCEGHQKDKRERLCRYISRPAVAVPRLSLSATGKVVYTLKTPYRDGTTQVAFDRGGHPPVDFVARLAALVPKPRVNLTRYHGVLAPNHRCRGLVTPGRRGKGIKSIANAEVRTAAERHAAMTWAQRLKRVFNIDIELCSRCGGAVKVIACIEDQDVIDRILAHLERKKRNTPALTHLAPPTRAPPETLALFAGKNPAQQHSTIKEASENRTP